LPEATFSLTVRDAIGGATKLLGEAGCETPRLDAELLVAEALQVSRAALFREPERVLDDELASFGGMVRRRCTREPIAYILGRKEFRHITLEVDSRVLIPRPETELLVEVGLSLPAGARVIDVGTGSGAIALALKHERPDLEVWGSDISADALDVARANGLRLGLDIPWLQADLLDGVPGGFDAVLANPPYVAAGSKLPPEIEGHEPASALYAGADGLDAIRSLVAQAQTVPLLGLEIGFDQAAAVRELLHGAGFATVEVRPDLAGHDRVLVGRR
jgi:release factor glutamine methyltransferase